MDKALVFHRTASGEATAAQPTRLVQHHLRSALAMVNGQRSAGEIVASFGGAAVGEGALEALQRAGLIDTAPALKAQSGGKPLAKAPAGAAGSGGLRRQITQAPGATSASIVETITIDVPDDGADFLPPAASRRGAAKARRATASSTRNLQNPATPAKAARRQWRLPRPRSGAITLLSLVVFLVLGAAVGLRFYPYERHLPLMEQRLSAALDQPVNIGRMSVSFSPHPSIVLHDVSIGKAEHPVTVARVHFLPDPAALTGQDFAVRDLSIEGMALSVGDLPLVARLLASDGRDAGLVRNGLSFSDARLRLGEGQLSGLRGDIGGGKGEPRVLRFGTGEGALSGELRSVKGGLQLRLASLGPWAPDFAAPLAFEQFEAEGRLTPDALTLERIGARIAEGSVEGDAKIMFSAADRIGGALELRQISLNRLLALTKSDVTADGSVSGRMRLSGSMSPAAAGNRLVLEGNVSVRNGALQGVDLIEAVRSSRREVRGGVTRFEEFAGQLRVEGQSWRISKLRLQAGRLLAQGQVAGERDRSVAGLVQVELRSSAGNLRVPVQVSGPQRAPVLSSSRGARTAAVPEQS